MALPATGIGRGRVLRRPSRYRGLLAAGARQRDSDLCPVAGLPVAREPSPYAELGRARVPVPAVHTHHAAAGARDDLLLGRCVEAAPRLAVGGDAVWPGWAVVSTEVRAGRMRLCRVHGDGPDLGRVRQTLLDLLGRRRATRPLSRHVLGDRWLLVSVPDVLFTVDPAADAPIAGARRSRRARSPAGMEAGARGGPRRRLCRSAS